MDIHRLDGDTVAEQATTKLRAKLLVRKAHQQDRNPKARGLSSPLVLRARKPTSDRLFPEQAFTDARFALVGGSGINSVLELNLLGLPTGQRLGLAPPDDPDAAVFFWRQAGEFDSGHPDHDGVVDAGAALAAALQTYATEHPPSGDHLDVALVVASDSPCLFEIETLSTPYLLAVNGFAQATGKQVLRFAAGSATAQDLALRVPAGGVEHAFLEIADSFGEDRLLDLTTGDGKLSVALKPMRWVGRRAVPVQAISARGVALTVKVPTGPARLAIQLQEDAGGRPSGKVLATGEVTLKQFAAVAQVNVPFENAAILATTPYWLLVVAAEGRVLWLSDEGEGQMAVFPQDADPADKSPTYRYERLLGRMRWLTRTSQGPASPAIELTLGQTTIVPLPRAPGRLVYDLAPCLNQWRQANQPVGPAEVALHFRSATGGIVTVYDPEFQYRL